MVAAAGGVVGGGDDSEIPDGYTAESWDTTVEEIAEELGDDRSEAAIKQMAEDYAVPVDLLTAALA